MARKRYFSDGCLSFAPLESQYKIPKAHFFIYLQVCNFTQKNFISFNSLQDRNPFDQLFPEETQSEEVISVEYIKLTSFLIIIHFLQRDSWQLDLNLCLHLVQSSQVKSSHIYLYSAFHNTDCIKAASQ